MLAARARRLTFPRKSENRLEAAGYGVKLLALDAWRQAFWVIVIAIFGALAASVVGLALFHGLPGAR
jgi:hypothetical protein